MFGWFFRKRVEELEKETKKGFISVKEDINSVGKWIKHLDFQDKQVFEIINELKMEISTIKEELNILSENKSEAEQTAKEQQLFKKLPVFGKQTAVEDVQKAVQTAVQTDNIYTVLKRLSGNERVLILTLLNSDMKLSYEDLALLVGKERSTIRGQINAIKQKSEGLIEEISEKNGKKRVFIPEEIREKMQKYAKVRVGKQKKGEKG